MPRSPLAISNHGPNAAQCARVNFDAKKMRMNPDFEGGYEFGDIPHEFYDREYRERKEREKSNGEDI